tara:strand:+ start:2437 stop:3276 length:840 start_codon:yes stop_codon:yes gene_type:complete
MEKNHEQTIMADEAKVIEYAKSYDWDDVRFLAKELGKKDLKIEKLNNQLDDFYRNKAENRKLKGEKEYWEKEHHELKLKVNWGSLDKYDARIKELITKNNKLSAENKKLKKEVNTEIKTIGEWVKLRDTALDRISELHEEIDELKAKVEKEKAGKELIAAQHTALVNRGYGQTKKLKKENEELKKKFMAKDCEVSQLRVQLEEVKQQEPYEYEVRNPEGKTRYLGRDFEEAKKYSEQMEDDGVPLHPPIMVYYVCPEEDEACYDNWFYIRTYETNPDDD